MNNKKTIAVLGIGGHSKVIHEIALLNGYQQILYFDDNIKDQNIIGKTSDLILMSDKIDDLFIAIGDNYLRKKKYEELHEYFNMVSLIHPKSVVSGSAIVKNGSVIMAGSVINPDVIIGICSIINTGSIIDHECVIANFVHISPGVKMGGQVKIGEMSWVGIGSTIINNINIGANVIIGASSLIINDAESNFKYIGIPAKKM